VIAQLFDYSRDQLEVTLHSETKVLSCAVLVNNRIVQSAHTRRAHRGAMRGSDCRTNEIVVNSTVSVAHGVGIGRHRPAVQESIDAA
jgi:hypothetical protein